MSRRRCLFCQDLADSREHPMLASLGALRVNWKLLCRPHNQHFRDTLDRAVADDLRFHNSRLGVKSAHKTAGKRRVSTARFRTTNTGREFIVSDGQMGLAGQRIHENGIVDGSRRIVASFETRAQLEAFKEGILAENKPVTFTEFKRRPIIAGRNTYEHQFGGETTLRGVTRIALSFLAKSFPTLARHAALAPVRTWILTGGTGDFARFDYGEASSSDRPNLFPFGHRVIVGRDPSTGTVYARVSFFGTFEIAIQFGVVPSLDAGSVITDIDPLANAQPKDQVECELMDAIGVPNFGSTPSSLTELQGRVLALETRLRAHEWARVEDALVHAVNECRTRSGLDRITALEAALEGQAQRLYNLQHHVNQEFHRYFREEGAEQPALPADLLAWDSLVEGNDQELSGLTPLAWSALQALKTRLAEHLSTMLDAALIDGNALRFVLEGSEGVRLAAPLLVDAMKTIAKVE